MALITPERLVALKNKVKEECSRRRYKDPVSSYSAAAYDFSVVPAKGQRILKEHYEKIAVPLNAITGDIDTNGARIIDESEIADMESKIDELADISRYASNSGCAASCTGLCQTSCSGSCDGSCSGDCDGGCTGCGGSCSDDCMGCTGACGSGCSSGCGGCGDACSVGCGGYCEDGCTDGCIAQCRHGCGDYCSGSAGASCGSGCADSCSGDCWNGAARGASNAYFACSSDDTLII